MEEFLRYYDHFVLPFALGVLVLFGVVVYKYVKWYFSMPAGQRGRVTAKGTFQAVGETVCESLLHRRIWRVNPLLGYMHTSLALGWFLLIVVGWVESSMHFNAAIMPPYTHVFFKFFGPTAVETTTGRLLGFLMDALLLFVLSGVLLAWIKRLRSRLMGLRKATKHTLFDRLAMLSLWFVFPARLVAESATSGIDGGHTFLTGALGEWMAGMLTIGQLYNLNAGAWWVYSLVLGVFFVSMPFSRYMHIFTEVPLIFLRRWGVRAGEEQGSGDNFQVEACSRCGICLDPCPVTGKVQAAYFLRDRRYHHLRRATVEGCLMCGRCEARCPVGIEVGALRLQNKRKLNDVPVSGRYEYFPSSGSQAALGGGLPSHHARSVRSVSEALPALPESSLSENRGVIPKRVQRVEGSHVGYFAGCMTLLSPPILGAMEKIFAAAGDDVWWADREGGVCCGRPLKLSGETSAARKMMDFNERLFREAGITLLVTSCPICLRVFREDYNLEGIEVLHHTEYIARVIKRGALRVNDVFDGELTIAQKRTMSARVMSTTPSISSCHPEASATSRGISHSGNGSVRNDKNAATHTYHDPCELGRGCGIYDAPREVLRRLGELREPEHNRKEAPCCGGSLACVNIAGGEQRRIGRELAAELEATGASTIVTSCPQCRRSVAAATTLPVRDIAEIVASFLIHN